MYLNTIYASYVTMLTAPWLLLPLMKWCQARSWPYWCSELRRNWLWKFLSRESNARFPQIPIQFALVMEQWSLNSEQLLVSEVALNWSCKQIGVHVGFFKAVGNSKKVKNVHILLVFYIFLIFMNTFLN